MSRFPRASQTRRSRVLYKHYRYYTRYEAIQWWTRRDVVLRKWIVFGFAIARERFALFICPWLR